MPDPEQTNAQSSAILKELSDIKATLAVNTNETVNIKGSLSEMKGDIKEIKNDFVPRREFNEGLKAIRDGIPDVSPLDQRVTALESKVNKMTGALIICQSVVLPVLLYLFYQALK